MRIKRVLTVLLLMATLLVTQAGMVRAQGGNPPAPSLTSEQMKNAIVVQDGRINSRPQRQGAVYRLANCDTTNSGSPCYFTISGSGKLISGSSLILMSVSETLVCGVDVYSWSGIQGARLQQNVNVTWWGTSGVTPVTMNWGDLGGTTTYLPYWTQSNFSGPTPNPGWGVYVSSADSAYSDASALLTYAPPPPLAGSSTIYATRLTINSGGWYCS